MKKSTGVSENEKGGAKDEGDSNNKITQRKVKSAKSKPNGQKRAYEFVGDRILNDESEHEQ